MPLSNIGGIFLNLGMSEAITQRPRSVMEVFKMLPEGTLAEVIENVLYMSPAPTPKHQKVSIILSSALFHYVEKNELGEVYYSPIDVFLDEISNAVQPDIVFFYKETRVKTTNSGLHGTPDFIIEILSGGNSKHDLITKKDLYQKFGVKEYWVIDPESGLSKGFELKGNTYEFLGEFKKEIQSKLLGQVFRF